MKKESARQGTAVKRIDVLFEQALMRPAFAKRYVALARKMASRHKARIPIKWRRRFCKQCNALFVPGRNCTVRKRRNVIVITCLECKSARRFGLR